MRVTTASLVASVLLTASAAVGDVTLPAVIGDHMVLQRDMALPIWGWADPGEEVRVDITLNDAAAATKTAPVAKTAPAVATAGRDGAWRVKLLPMKAGGPYTLTVSGKNSITVQDVLVGEVWVCSGQSNMEFELRQANNSQQEVAQADYPKIRLFEILRVPAGAPKSRIDAHWQVCSPKTAANFSAVGYFFGRHLHKELDGVPVGLVDSTWGGTRIEPWTPVEGFRADPELAKLADWAEQAHVEYQQGKVGALKKLADWLAVAQKVAADGGDIPDPPPWPKDPVANPGSATALYNGMIHPIVPFAIRGAVWYQGEANRGNGMHYLQLMKALVGGWRQVWGQGDFPFYYVQLAPYNYGNFPTALPEIWEAQTAALAIPNTGMAVTVDIGDVKDIHPKNKQEVGRRLALWALAKTYGRDKLVYSGPLYKAMKIEGDSIRVTFEHTGGGLASRDGQALSHFTIAGEDKHFVPAQAKIDGDSVVVHSPMLDKPTAVRFAWEHTAEPNLMNTEGLPASPFRTDRWSD